ncbi:hypothetical protein EJ08DRAFT_700268 [Tothia fuscella]|uniref:Altered inheritance of mitochondria protein 6 n=1 Tax=Tothia fuscella TaxID=1048955 RepID=A0A9P4NLC6_9PEZI|nr:hypothetical protein EJ08DRAFT_700268 [Tothia fuscella]
MGPIYLDEDVEPAGGRSSEELSESDALMEMKPSFSASSSEGIDHNDRCRNSQPSPPWRDAFKTRVQKGRPGACCSESMKLESPARKARSRNVRRCRIFGALLTVCFALFGVYNVISIIVGLGPLFWDPDFDIFFPNWGQKAQVGESLSSYPTDFTRDILPIPVHSHNDYWRRIPLYEAIHYGVTGVEADVWLFDDEELYVGHTASSLTRNRTFKSLYVDPLVKLLDRQNLHTPFANETRNGIFDVDPSQTMVLLVDFKTDGSALFPYVEEHLTDLREKNYLTYYDGVKVIPGPITVVGTGNAPFQLITANNTYRDIFFDAPLDKLTSDAAWLQANPPYQSVNHVKRNEGQGNTGVDPALGAFQFTSENSYYASVNFRQSVGFPWRGHLTHKQKTKLRAQIKAAHDKGLKARYWNTPDWPIGLRHHIWSVLVEEGADFLNVDDLKGAAMHDWRRRSQRDW